MITGWNWNEGHQVVLTTAFQADNEGIGVKVGNPFDLFHTVLVYLPDVICPGQELGDVMAAPSLLQVVIDAANDVVSMPEQMIALWNYA